MYFVSGGGGIGGITRSSETRIVEPGSMATFRGVLYRFPGARFHCRPSPWSIGSFTVLPSARRNVSYTCSRACTV